MKQITCFLTALLLSLGSSSSLSAAVNLEQRLSNFTTYKFGQSKDGLHAARMAAFSDSNTSTSASAQFVAQVAADPDPTKLIMSAVVGDDDARARQALKMVTEGVAMPAITGLLAGIVPTLPEARQIIVMNVLIQTNAREATAVIAQFSAEGTGAVRLAAIRNLGYVGHPKYIRPLFDLYYGEDEAASEAALRALQSYESLTYMKELSIARLVNSGPERQAKAIELAEALNAAFTAGALTKIANDSDNPNRTAAIRTLGKISGADAFVTLIQGYIDSVGGPAENAYRLAVWDMTRRQPDYAVASKVLLEKATSAPEPVKKALSSMESKLGSVKTVEAPAAPEVVEEGSGFVLPGSYLDHVPQHTKVLAYLNCGPQTAVEQNGVQIIAGAAAKKAVVPGQDASVSMLAAAETLRFTVSGLKANQDTVLGMTWWDADELGRQQSIWINGEEVLPDTRAIAYDRHRLNRKELPPEKGLLGRSTPVRIQFALLPEQIVEGSCQIEIRKVAGPDVVTSELWLAARASPKAEKQILLITGQDFPGHQWRKTSPVMEALIAADPRMEVTVCETPYALGLKHLDFYDVVVIHFKNYETSLPSTPVMRDNLEQFVTQGGGMVLSHFACGTFLEWPEFVNLSGRIWNGQGHDRRQAFELEVVDAAHPVTDGLPGKFETYDELYFCLKGEPEVHELCRAMSQVKNEYHPQAFVYEPGQGRVFMSTLGHDVQAFEAREVCRLYRQGVAWAAGLERPVASLKFVEEAASYSFDTGALSGQLKASSKSRGLSAVFDYANSEERAQGIGLAGLYRIFDKEKRYDDGRGRKSESRLLPDGAVEYYWAADAKNPFEMRAVYRWVDARTLDYTMSVTPQQDMEDFEAYFSNYVLNSDHCAVYTGDAKQPFTELLGDDGVWHIFPRDGASAEMINDGRWNHLPHPVEWIVRPDFKGALGIRRNTQSGATTVLMGDPEDCFALSGSYGAESHHALYLSLFGRAIKAGETDTVSARLIIGDAVSDEEAIELYKDYLKSP